MFSCVAFYFFRSLKFDLKQVEIMPERTEVLDRNGKLIGKMHGQNRTIVSFDQISPNFLMSIIAREDARFYEHNGVDYRGLARATVRNIKDRGMTQGASTITMQLARNSFELSQGKRWYHELDRKVLEVFVAKRIEWEYEKTKILECYCNRIFWGHSMLGIEAASQAYLRKPAKDLTLSEGAMLAGIVRGPNAFSPFRSLTLATRERNTVLDRLVYYHYITAEEAQKAKNEKLIIRPKTSRTKSESYAIDAISKELSFHLKKNNIKIGGLTIHTTIDDSLQKTAEKSIRKRLEAIEKKRGYPHQTQREFQSSRSNAAPAYLQGALVCIDNKTGGIIATVGGRDADESRFNRAYNAKRQIGSLFKPFVFQAAFDRGLRPLTLIDDSKIKPGDIDHVDQNWSPSNSDGKYLGLITAKEALSRSRNTSCIRVGDYATLSYVNHAANVAGFNLFQREKTLEGKTPNNATSYLGSWEASPEEVARAYTIFPNQGQFKQPFIISEIVDRNGTSLYKRNAGLLIDESLSKGATYEVSKILEEINVTGTASSLRTKHGFNSPSGGKTGTTNDFKDAWYAGYTSKLTCAVWVGLDTPKKIIQGGYGSRLALPIWADLMKASEKIREFAPTSLNNNLSSKSVLMCNRSARLANNICKEHGCAYTDVITTDLYKTLNKPCSIHTSGYTPLTNPSLPKQNNESLIKEEKVKKAIEGFFDRLLGKKEPSTSTRKPQRAIIVEDELLPPSKEIPIKAIEVTEEELIFDEVPVRAIIVEDE